MPPQTSLSEDEPALPGQQSLSRDFRDALEGDGPAFLSHAQRAGARMLALNSPIVVHHYDADGLSSGALVSLALSRSKRPHTLSVQKRVDPTIIASVKEEALARTPARDVIFVDLGSGALPLIESTLLSAGIKVGVIDHHQPAELVSPPATGTFSHVNCSLYGFDGGTSASAATTAYFCFRDATWLDESGHTRSNADLSVLGTVGAVGDMQDQGGLHSLNRMMLRDGVDSGYIACSTGPRLFGRVSRTLVNFLSYSQEPSLPGLSGDERACARFLESHGIPFYVGTMSADNTSAPAETSTRWLTYSDLPPSLQKKFASALITHCLQAGMDEPVMASLFGEVYGFPRSPPRTELADAYEYATLLNACGRHGHETLGIQVCCGVKGAFSSARAILAEHRMAISKGLRVAQEKTNDLGPFLFLDGRGLVSETVIGTVIGSSFTSGLHAPTKPILGFSLSVDGSIKVSGRGTKELVARGLDLNVVMHDCSAAVGGFGGGHKVAAGASIPAGKENEFLREAARVIEAQLSNSSNST